MKLTVKTWSDTKIEAALPEIKPTVEACLNVFPHLAQFNDRAPADMPRVKITAVQMQLMMEKLGILAPVTRWEWYTGEVEYNCPTADAYFKFYQKYLSQPVMALDWRLASWVCRDEALMVMERSREWLNHMAITIGSCYPAPNYIKNFPWGHAFNLAFLANSAGVVEAWFVDSTWEVITNFSTNSERYGILEMSGVFL